MEPITLCAAVIAAFGLWIELRILVRTVVKAARGSRMLMKLLSLLSEQKPVFANRYVEYAPRELRGQHS